MFESIKKKFSNATKKLSRKVSEDAIKEDNIKKIESSDEMSQSPQFDQVAQIELEESNEKNLASKDNETEKIIDNKNSDVDEFLEDEKFLKIQKNDESFENEEILESQEVQEGFESEKVVESQEVQEGFESEKVVESQEVQETTKDDEKSKDNKTNEKQNFGFFSFIREKKISQKDIEDILWELELSLLESDVAIDVANTVIESVKEDLIGQKIKRSKDIEEFTYKALKNAVSEIISIDGKTMTEMIEEKNSKGQPLIVMFVGINGTGKTTTIAKISNYYLKMGYTPVVAASDTFRAGAIEQLTHHTDNLNVKIIKHQKGSDPAAVAYDAVEHAKAKDKELVLIDTAGRMQTNTNLMDEMKKIKRVAKPDIVVFVGDALTGNDAVEQAIKFNNAIDIDGVILTKADADSKGGASLSIGYVISKPIMFLGMGQGYDDIKEYDSEWMLEQIFS